MTDVMDELRDANPVDAASLDVPAELRSRALAGGPPSPPPRAPRPQRRGLRAAGLIAVAACALIAALLVGSGSDGPADLSARAYAATTGPGIIHWRTEITGSSGGKVRSRQRAEGWTRNGVTHELRFDVVHGKGVLQGDTRTAEGRTTIWQRAAHDYLRMRARRQSGTDPFQFGDPFAIFRRAYRAGKLTKVGPARFGVDLPGRSDDRYRNDPQTYYDIDPDTALPVRFVAKSPALSAVPGHPEVERPAGQTVMTFAVYEKLPFNQATRAKLRLLPHRAGGPKAIVAAEHFAVLRTGARPGPDAAKAIAGMARAEGQVDAGAARAVAPGMYLLPGPRQLCLVQITARGSGRGCTATEEAIQRGIATSEPGGAVSLVVPDGVAAVRARLRGKRSQRVAVHDNFAKLPGTAFAWQFLR